MAASTAQTDALARQVALTFTNPPLLSSLGAGWEHLFLALNRQSPVEVPEFSLACPIVCINYGSPLTIDLRLDGRSHRAQSIPGDISIYPAGLWQSFQCNTEAVFLDLFLDPAILAQTGQDLLGRNDVELVTSFDRMLDPLIYQMGTALKRSLEVGGPGTRLYADTMTNALAAHLVTHYASGHVRVKRYTGGLSAQHVQQVIAYIHEYLDRDLRLVELAQVAQLSPYYFSRLFKQSTGLAPHQYHTQCRVERAKQLLRTGALSIPEVACAVGFASQSHLNYHFKRWVGVTPKRFLQQR